MQHILNLIQIVAFLASFAALGSRLLEASRPFWGRVPAWAQTLLPALVPTIAALAQGLAGVKTWADLSVLFMVCAAMLLPGLPSNRSAAPLQFSKPVTAKPSQGDLAVAEVVSANIESGRPRDKTPPPVVGLFVLLLCCGLALQQTACARGITAKTVDQAAIILCDAFFAKQPGNLQLSFEDVEKAFCSTAKQLEPFLHSAQLASERGGAIRLNRAESTEQ